VFESAEITGDVHIGHHSIIGIIGAGVKIIGDSHGPVRIGARVRILENTMLHLLPDNDLIVGDDVTIGPGCMIHGCHIGAGTVVEPAAIVHAGSLERAKLVMGRHQPAERRHDLFAEHRDLPFMISVGPVHESVHAETVHDLDQLAHPLLNRTLKQVAAFGADHAAEVVNLANRLRITASALGPTVDPRYRFRPPIETQRAQRRKPAIRLSAS